ncbi:uncharacterized protein CANTADRAFT_92079 [Suhomyces tanzawaensis NRRL Y-17324]|uniref:Intramembrane protease n=1 Tax=Suhomyces tanzawaensis NRRL Y-17324 TaxID=984487 RepID=A0A1E4SDR7_9ASCO|nr:uncharacterized protein CANTADRAFT_92079 [Suhomyces tanzawaensis NRRL Y-17324]ODV77661.1 hypothetical protein CANTADRAFT_92079 [Suhomyces tanzawaensis NRRL Y-17324]
MSEAQSAVDAIAIASNPTNSSSILSFSWADQLAVAVPHILYANTTSVSPYLVQTSLFLAIATVCILIGSHSTVSKPRNAALPLSDVENPSYDPTDNDESKYLITSPESLKLAILQLDSIKIQHVVAFPFVTAATLFGLHRAIHYLSAEQINYWLNVHFMLVSFVAVYRNSNVMLNRFTRRFSKLFGKDSTIFFERYKLTLSTNRELPLGPIQHIDSDKLVEETKKDDTWLYKLRKYLKDQGFSVIGAPAIASDEYHGLVFDLKPLILLPLSLGSMYLFYLHNPILNSSYGQPDINWLILDFMLANMAAFAIGCLKFPNFKFMAILLGGLFLYDIYFVFQSNIMMEVATKVNAPIKILIPQQPQGFKVPMSLLGLGDIVIPGVLASLSLRFDLFNYHEDHPLAYHHLTRYPRPYFKTTVASYLIGLSLTFVVLHKTGNGQPALLYIVPSMFVGISLLATIRGEMSKLLSFDETIKEFDEKNYDNIGQDDESDSDYNFSGDDSLDEWIDRVEEDRNEDATDIDEFLKQAPKTLPRVVYTFNSDSESDEEDDTYIIGEEEESDIEDLEDLEAVDELLVVEESELILIKKDLKKEVREVYSDEE